MSRHVPPEIGGLVAEMTYGRFDGVAREASRLVVGMATVTARNGQPELWDAFHERGGNCFDGAHSYGAASERSLGAWIASRGVRDEVVLIGKGAHTPECRPDAVAAQLSESLERLGTDHMDLYLLHRDDPAVPVGEFVDAVDAEVRAGRARAAGVSNWTVERAEAFDAYATANGRARLSALSNQLSLAQMIEPPWPGCLSAFDAQSRAWLAEKRLPLVAWSAQARGFFSGRADDKEVARCWRSEANLERRRRVQEIAVARGIHPVSVALAYVLAQRFPTFAVVGVRTPQELERCAGAFTVELSPPDIAWLDLARG